MTQNAPKTNTQAAPARQRPVLARIAAALAGGASVLALSAPLAGGTALAQDWQVTTQYFPGAAVRTYRKIGPDSGSLRELKYMPAPGNRCPGSAFEVVNPGPGEVRCVGYVEPGNEFWGER